MKGPVLVVPPSRTLQKPFVVRLLWMAIIWVAGVACVLAVSLVLRAVLHP
jgi:hypothetical protein